MTDEYYDALKEVTFTLLTLPTYYHGNILTYSDFTKDNISKALKYKMMRNDESTDWRHLITIYSMAIDNVDKLYLVAGTTIKNIPIDKYCKLTYNKYKSILESDECKALWKKVAN